MRCAYRQPTEIHLELSGAIYPFSRLHEASVVSQVQSTVSAGLHRQNDQALAELAIASGWLAQWLEPRPIPDMRDAASGDPNLLVTDHYRVHDAASLVPHAAPGRDGCFDGTDPAQPTPCPPYDVFPA